MLCSKLHKNNKNKLADKDESKFSPVIVLPTIYFYGFSISNNRRLWTPKTSPFFNGTNWVTFKFIHPKQHCQNYKYFPFYLFNFKRFKISETFLFAYAISNLLSDILNIPRLPQVVNHYRIFSTGKLEWLTSMKQFVRFYCVGWQRQRNAFDQSLHLPVVVMTNRYCSFRDRHLA